MSFDLTSKLVVAMSAEGSERARAELANVAKSVDKVTGLSDSLGRVWTGLLGGLTAAAFAGWIKGSIDAADATNEMAQKTGLAHKQVAGVELAYKQAGLGSEAMASSIGKLSKQMVEGNAAFDTLGIKTRNIDGTMRSTKDVLYDTADAFSGIKDGAAKAALAQEIFGRSGTDMLPVLNGGAEGFREMAAMAEKLGLVISEDAALAADQFNDQVELLGMGLSGVGRQVAAQLLPTLTSLSSSFLESMTQGDALRKTADFLGTALRGVYTGGVLVVEVFNTAGKVLGAAAAQIAAILRGDISGWVTIAQEAAADIKAGWTSTAESIARAWDTSGNAVVQGLAKVAKSQRDLNPASKEGIALAKAQAAVWKDLEAELEKASDAGQKYGESIDARNSILERELLLGRDLTEAEKAQIDLTEKLAAGTLYLTRTDEAATRAKIDLGEQLRRQKGWLDAAQQGTLELAKARDAEYVALLASTRGLQEQAQTQELANITTATGIDYSEAMSIAKLREAATTQELNAIRVEERELNYVLGQQYRDNAEALRRLAKAKEGANVLTRMRAEADELNNMFRGFGQVLEDALVDGGQKALDSIEKEFERAVIHMVVQGALNNGYAGVAGALGMAGGSTGAGSWLGAANGAYGVGSNLAYAAGGLWGLTGMSTGASAASLTYANAVGAMGGDSLGALISANGGWSGVSAGAGAGASSSAASAIPIIGWILAALMASNAAYRGGNTVDMIGSAKDWGVGAFETHKYDTLSKVGFSDQWAQILSGAPIAARLFGHKASVSGFGVGSISGGDFLQSTTAPLKFGDNTLGGGVSASLQDTVSDLAAAVGIVASTFGGGLTEGLKLGAFTDADRDGQISSLIGYLSGDKLIAGAQTGSGAFGAGGPGVAASKIAGGDLQEWIATQLPLLIVQGLQQSDLDDRFDEYFDSIAAAGLSADVAQQMLNTAATVQKLTDTFAPIGGVFTQFDTLSVSAFESLATLSGGFDAVGASASSYYQTFYSEAERTQGAWDTITQVLADVGINTVPATMDSFRQLVDTLKLNKEEGREAYVALMGVSGAFSQLVAASDASAAAIADKRLDLEIELLRAQGNEMGALNLERERELDALRELDPTLASLQQQIYAASDAANTAGSAMKNLGSGFGSLGEIDQAAAASADSRERFRLGQDFLTRLNSGTLPTNLQKYVDERVSKFPNIYSVGGFAGGPLQGMYAMQMRANDAIDNGYNKRELNRGGGASEGRESEYAARLREQAEREAKLREEQNDILRKLIASTDSLNASLGDYLESLNVGEFSVLTQQQQLAHQRELLEGLWRQALDQNDLAAAAAFRESSQTFLQLSLAQNASGMGFVNDRAFVVEAIESMRVDMVEEIQKLSTHAAAQVRVAQDGVQQTVSELKVGNKLASDASMEARFAAQK